MTIVCRGNGVQCSVKSELAYVQKTVISLKFTNTAICFVKCLLEIIVSKTTLKRKQSTMSYKQ